MTRIAERHAPVILVHGLFGFERIGFGPWTLLAYFRGIPEALRRRGYRVLAPRVHPTGGIARRARDLGTQIEACFPGEAVHIIGHSMGGLDARELLKDPRWENRVLTLTTVGTPHLGSALAEEARRRLGSVYRLLHSVGWDHQGFLDLVPDKALRWHEESLPPTDVPCYSVAGAPESSEAVCWPLRWHHGLLERLEGPNDGLVSVESALAFGEPLGGVTLDHLRQMNWYTGAPGSQVGAPVRALYRRILRTLGSHDPALLEVLSA